MLLTDNTDFINEISIYVNKHSTTNLQTRLYLYKVINIFKNYKQNKQVHNLFLLLILPHKITKKIYKCVNFVNMKYIIETNEHKIFKIPIIESYETNISIMTKSLKSIGNNNELMFYQCVCGSKDIKVREKQLRSLDEPSTILMKCNNCGNRWSPKY